ncbi:50S ribosomal protein L10 [Mariniphaga sediminis]|jgi:large subunit ribosomal protein L10|uniref:Large ribosomal subunit protein uL10 n=1 Tax=Mariniphaga sediminis TaxID=1628158 RepID=A0A399D3E6_9BACT|nr:50S ribosomal protein L10 [Mariniphaga sediminis]RIH66077.1 50S ribosomal protein L10 [Mariniphaga sediminis]
MKSTEKKVIIDNLKNQIDSYNHFYLTDISGLNAADTSDLRRLCFKQDVKLVVAKNTLLRKALESSEKNTEELYDALKGNTSVMFAENGNVPAKLIKEFQKKHKKPLLKAAFVEESVYMGENQLDALIAVKSKNELIADVVALLKSPMQTVLSQLQSGGNTIHGVLETLKERE